MKIAPVTILAHSLGGMITNRFVGLYREKVRRFVNIYQNDIASVHVGDEGELVDELLVGDVVDARARGGDGR